MNRGAVDLVVAADSALSGIAETRPGMGHAIGARSVGASSSTLMRIDHAGEVCAQALYVSQAVGARDAALRSSMLRAAEDELSHLRWTAERLNSLSARRSILEPIWFAGSILAGGLASLRGDAFSLGFLAETERQVERHLDGHLRLLAVEDEGSRCILRQMRADEGEHAAWGEAEGARDLPLPVRVGMRLAAKVMTSASALV